ncbi:MAG: MerR family transcriptional regulator [Clostridia bacterium]|nr:MerR family transcriptional regulator [Clostridia bacterium]
MKVQLSVHELSKIVGVSPRTIRYYATQGLFEHSGIQSNGYRYYTIEKIEELRLIVYLRYLDVPMKEIKTYLENRSFEDYDAILERQLAHTHEKIRHLQFLEARLEKRLNSIRHIRSLPKLDTIAIQTHPARRILRINEKMTGPLEWEKAMLKFEQQEHLPPSLIIGDIGFFVDLNSLDSRHPTEFTGLYLISDEPLLFGETLVDFLPAGRWLTYICQGDHQQAAKLYPILMAYAEKENMILADYAIERMLLNHFISSAPTISITEIAIPIIDG